MPTYTNNSNVTYPLSNEGEGVKRFIKPGETIETRAYYNLPNLNLDSADPYEEFIGSSGRETIDSTTGITLTSNGFPWIECDCNGPTIIYYNSLSTLPEYRPAGLFLINNTDNTANQIIIKTVSGTATLTYSVKKE